MTDSKPDTSVEAVRETVQNLRTRATVRHSHWSKKDIERTAEWRAAALLEAQQAEIERLQAWRASAMEQLVSSRYDVLQGDDVVVCKDCSGSGYRVYGTTATWRGGVGGATMTSDVCNKCWGSGKSNRPWPSHRARAAG